MIENIIHHIEKRGYHVDVLPGTLLIRTYADEKLFGIDWAISRYDLEPVLLPVLCDEADRRIYLLEEAIAKEHLHLIGDAS